MIFDSYVPEQMFNYSNWAVPVLSLIQLYVLLLNHMHLIKNRIYSKMYNKTTFTFKMFLFSTALQTPDQTRESDKLSDCL